VDWMGASMIVTLPSPTLQSSVSLLEEIHGMIGDVNLFLVEDESDQARERCALSFAIADTSCTPLDLVRGHPHT
jgi:hypothetical protein